MEKIRQQAAAARRAARELAGAGLRARNRALRILARKVILSGDQIIKANRVDLRDAAAANRNAAYLDRLAIGIPRLEKMAASLSSVAALPDPLGRTLKKMKRPNGLLIEQVTVPIGVIAIIYESRPDVTTEAFSLCLKSGNAVILKGGSDSLRTNAALAELARSALAEAGLPADSISLVASRDRRSVNFLLTLDEYLDLVIPRGGEALIRTVVKKSRVPVIKHYQGVCHTFVDRSAALETAWSVTLNAKIQRPGTCNATEALLVHRKIADAFLPEMCRLLAENGVEIRGCPETLGFCRQAVPAGDDDWGREFLDLTLAVKVVDDLESAVEFINRHGTGHSEAIITEDAEAAEFFLRMVDASAVYHNASTRFTDGFEFGLGAEIGISTDRIHARGPMGLRELTSYKYLVRGQGQLRT